MAWTTITHSCNHESQRQLYGPGRQRDYIVEQESKKLCSDCWKAEQDKQNAAKAAVAQASYPDLPALTGTPRQIIWAGGLRSEALDKLAEAVGSLQASSTPPSAELFADVVGYVKLIKRQAAASYWIDRRNDFSSVSSVLAYIGNRITQDKNKAAGKNFFN